jgi:hypothetical protein
LTKIPISRHPTCHTTIDSNFAPCLFLKPPFGLPRGDSLAPYIDEKDVFLFKYLLWSKKCQILQQKEENWSVSESGSKLPFETPFRPPLRPPRGSLGVPQGSQKIQVS